MWSVIVRSPEIQSFPCPRCRRRTRRLSCWSGRPSAPDQERGPSRKSRNSGCPFAWRSTPLTRSPSPAESLHGVLGVAQGAAQVAGAASSPASGASGTGGPLRRLVRGGGAARVPPPTGAWASPGPRARGPPVEIAPCPRSGANPGRRARSGSRGPICYSGGQPTGPNSLNPAAQTWNFRYPQSGSVWRTPGDQWLEPAPPHDVR